MANGQQPPSWLAPRLRALQGVPFDKRGNQIGVIGSPPGAADIAPSAPFARIVYPPRIEKMLSSQDFTGTDFAITLGAGAGTTAVSTNLQFQLPASMVGWLQFFSLYVLSQTALTAIQFAVRINQNPIAGLTKQNPPGVANLVLREFSDIRVRIPDGALVDVLITNLNANGPWTVGGEISGWYHSKADEERTFGSQY